MFGLFTVLSIELLNIRNGLRREGMDSFQLRLRRGTFCKWSLVHFPLVYLRALVAMQCRDDESYIQYTAVQCCVMLYTQAERGLLSR